MKNSSVLIIVVVVLFVIAAALKWRGSRRTGLRQALLAGLKEMGAPGAAVLLERAMAVFPGEKPPADRLKRQLAMDKIRIRAAAGWE